MPSAWQSDLREAGCILVDGVQGPDVLRRLFSACDGAFLLSRNENFPTVVCEALACGCPVMSRSIGGVAEMIEPGTTGWLTPADSGFAALASAAAALTSATAERRQAWRAGCRAEAVRRFGRERMTRDYERIYTIWANVAPRQVPGRRVA